MAPSRFGKKRGGDDLAYVSFFGPVAIEPRVAGAGFVDKDEMFALGEEDALKLGYFLLRAGNLVRCCSIRRATWARTRGIS